MGKIIQNGIEYSGTYSNATSINYDGSVSGLNAKTVQEGIDELSNSLGGFQFKVVDGKKQISTNGGSTWENFSSGAELLWTNPAPNNTVPVGTKIDVDLSGYEYVLITTLGWYQTYPTYGISTCCIKIGESVSYNPANERWVEYTTTPTSVTKSAVDSLTSNGGLGHQYFIPYQIYGINTDLRFINSKI